MEEYKVGETFNLQVEITDETMKDTVIKQLQYILNSNYSEIIPGLKLKGIFKKNNQVEVKIPNVTSNDISINANKNIMGTNWSPDADCRHDCQRCNKQCLYRKEKYQAPKIEKPKYNGGWVDMYDKGGMSDMFNSLKL